MPSIRPKFSIYSNTIHLELKFYCIINLCGAWKGVWNNWNDIFNIKNIIYKKSIKIWHDKQKRISINLRGAHTNFENCEMNIEVGPDSLKVQYEILLISPKKNCDVFHINFGLCPFFLIVIRVRCHIKHSVNIFYTFWIKLQCA